MLKVPGNKNRKLYSHVLIDTGNLSSEALISEEFYKKLRPECPVRPVTRKLIGAGDNGNYLETIGRADQSIAVVFRDPQDRSTHEYRLRPIVVRNLGQTMLLSHSDLCTLNAQITPFKSEMTIPHVYREDPIRVPLFRAPARVAIVKTTARHVIPPNNEAVFAVEAVGVKPNKEVVTELDLSGLNRFSTGLTACATVDRVRDKNLVHVRVMNLSDRPVTIKKGQEIGHATPVSLYTGEKDKKLQTVSALTRSSQFQERQQKRLVESEFKKILTPEELFKRLWEDLGFDKEDHGLDREQKKKVVKMFARHRGALCLNYDEVGHVKDVEIKIDTGDNKPVKHKLRQLNPTYRKALKEQLQRWMAQDIIEPCDGPWANAIVAIPKKNGGVRFCADYRDLNRITRRDCRPIAHLEERLSKVRGDPKEPIRFFASVDLSEAYHSVPVCKADREKTAIVTPEGLYQFKRMPFGLAAAPAAFHQVVKLIESAMEKRDPQILDQCLLYFDDALLSAPNFDELLERLEILLEAVEEVGMKIQVRKCSIGFGETKWLGHKITANGIFPDEDRVRMLRDWPTPQTRSQVHKFHGLASTFRKFIRNFAKRTENMRALLKRDANSSGKDPIKWTEKCEKEKEDIVNVLTSAPMLGHPDWSEDASPFIITVDTSSHGIGCTLSQQQTIQDDETKEAKRREVIIYYGSRRLTAGESRYSAYKLELCGVLHAVEHFKYYLLGRKFLIRTDHRALEWLRKTTNPKTPSTMFRWQDRLSEFDFDIVYVPATKMKLADGLSRRPFNEGERDNILPLLPKRDVEWEDDPEIESARATAEDSFWIPVMTKKHGSPVSKTKSKTTVDQLQSKIEKMDISDQIVLSPITAIAPAEAFVNPTMSINVVTRSQGEVPVFGLQHTLTPVQQRRLSLPVTMDNKTWAVYCNERSTFLPGEQKMVQTYICCKIPATLKGRLFVEHTFVKGRSLEVLAHPLEDAIQAVQQKTLWPNPKPNWDGLLAIKCKNNSRRLVILEKNDIIAHIVLKPGNPTADGSKTAATNVTSSDEHNYSTPETPPKQQIPAPMDLSANRIEDDSKNPGGENVDEIADFSSNVATTSSDPVNLDMEIDDNQLGHDLHHMPTLSDLGKFIIREEEDEKQCFQNWCAQKQRQDEVIELLLMAQHHQNKQELLDKTDELRTYLKNARPNATPERLDQQVKNAKTLGQLLKKKKLFVTNGLMRVRDQSGPLVIPYDERKIVVAAVHSASGTFHLGSKRTYDIAKTHFYFPNLSDYIYKYIEECTQCQRGKRLPSRRGPGMGQTTSIPHERLKTWSMDIMAFPVGFGGMEKVLTLIDVATSWIEAFPLRKATGKAVAKVLREEILPRYGESLVFTVDQGREMTSNVVKEAIKDMDGQIYLTTAHHSQSNPVERHHLTFANLIRSKLQDMGWAKEKWPLAVPEAKYTMRCAPDSLTKESPYFRVFGKHPKTRVNRFFGNPDESPEEEQPNPWAPGSHVVQDNPLERTVATVHVIDTQIDKYRKLYPDNPKEEPLLVNTILLQDAAQKRKDDASLKRHHENKIRYDTTKMPKYYLPAVGEMVDYYEPYDETSQFNRKLAMRWNGPYRVIEKPDHDFTCSIRKLDATTLNLTNERIKRVWIGDLRPSTVTQLNERPRGDWIPPWMPKSSNQMDARPKEEQEAREASNSRTVRIRTWRDEDLDVATEPPSDNYM